MNTNTQNLKVSKLPNIEDVIRKVKHLEELTPEEDLVYLIYIEELPIEVAIKMVDINNNQILSLLSTAI